MSEICILCKSNDLKIIQNIDVSKINKLYLNELDLDIMHEFKGNTSISYKKCLNCNLRFFSPVLTGSPAFYESLLKPDAFYYKDNRYEFFKAKEYIKKADKVLEIGSGSGHFSKIINVDDYTGLEYNDKAIQDAKSNGINLIKKSIEEFAVENENLFDVVCSFQVLEHVDNPYNYIQASLKVLKKGGLLIFGVPSADSRLTNNINHTLNFPPHHITRWHNRTIERLESIFDLTLINIHNEPINERLAKKFTVNEFTDLIYRIFTRKEIVISNFKRYSLVRKITKKIITTFKFRFKTDGKRGEAVLVILKKKS